MPLFEVETEGHIIITWAADEDAAAALVNDSYPNEGVIRLTKRPRDTWVISKAALGITGKTDPCNVARDCLAKAEGDKVRAIRLYMHETGADLRRARKAIESKEPPNAVAVRTRSAGASATPAAASRATLASPYFPGGNGSGCGPGGPGFGPGPGSPTVRTWRATATCGRPSAWALATIATNV